ncbi:MAG: acetyl-CoA carboxylase biotin carboxyl carrier protein subunit [Thermodesulfobacteriota bacterium]|nr:acetyl-CoA carboxylase biotin carboxyl carrier protein subunit [Thermodesulfobacteriota bacterium]
MNESGGVALKAPMTGTITTITVKVGDSVSVDDEIGTMEAMKMEIPLISPASGKIKEIKVEVGQSVQADDVLAIVE